MRICVPIAAVIATLAVLAGGLAPAHEIDQYSVPVGQEFADLSGFWNEFLHDSVSRGVAEANQQIERAMQVKDAARRQAKLDELHSPDAVARAVFKQQPNAYSLIENLERKFHNSEEMAKYPGKVLAYKSPVTGCIYSRPSLLPDLRQFARVSLLRCSTIKVHDAYIGTDKIGHFYGMGYYYYEQYRKSLRAGESVEQATKRAVEYGHTGPISERGLIGSVLAGIYSNADMTANYLGLKFFINLTEPVRLKGQVVGPMLERDGELWRMREHVRVDNGLFGLYICPHLDEVINPCLYHWAIRGPIKEGIKYRQESLLDWYASGDPAKRSRAYFDGMLMECLTYWGEDYGHSGELENLITVGNTCFETPAPLAQKPASPWLRAATFFKPRF